MDEARFVSLFVSCLARFTGEVMAIVWLESGLARFTGEVEIVVVMCTSSPVLGTLTL